MPATDSPAILVARFLQSNNYTQSYEAFIHEAGLPPDAGTVSKGDLTLETLLEEKKTFDVSVRFEKLGIDDGLSGWSPAAPDRPHRVTGLPTASNILSASIERTDTGPVLLVTTADRQLHILDPLTYTLRGSRVGLQDSPILSCAVFRKQYLLTSSMSGQVIVSDFDGNVFEKRRDHTKYVIKIAVYEDSTKPLVATAGWDNSVVVYQPSVRSGDQRLSLGDPVATITLPTKPEALLFVEHPEFHEPLLVVGRTDSTFLHYYSAESPPRLLGRQNLAPHSNSWVTFTPSTFALSPADPSLLAVGLSTIPHMKLILVRMLIPPFPREPLAPAPAPPTSTSQPPPLDDSAPRETQASQARAALALADREHAAIRIHCTTLAPQTAYSTPAVAWRPDGSGVWVNGDDGAVRGVDARSGKVVIALQGHEAGSKVRCLCAAAVGAQDGVGAEDGAQEVLVSGGFDQNLLVWRVGER